VRLLRHRTHMHHRTRTQRLLSDIMTDT
jgi:hypothetical protein